MYLYYIHENIADKFKMTPANSNILKTEYTVKSDDLRQAGNLRQNLTFFQICGN